MTMKKISILSLILALFVQYTTVAQTGFPWKPANADTTFPRTIIHSWEIPDVKASLAAGQNLDVYKNLYSAAIVSVPSGNSTISERSDRATIAKNAAYVYLLGIKPNGNTTANLLPAEKTAFKNKAISLLEQTNTYVYSLSLDSPLNFDLWQYLSKYMIMEIEAYDFLKGAGVHDSELVVSKNALKNWIGNLYYNTTIGIAGTNFFQGAKNNHALMSAGAIGLAAVVFNDLTDTVDKFRPINWINCAMWNIHNVLWWDIRRTSDVKKNSGYAEGTYYFRYAFVNLLPFFKAMGNFLPDTTVYYNFNLIDRKIRNPWYDTNYVKLYDWIASIRFPDGRIPPIEDSYVTKMFPELAILRQQKYLWQMNFSNLDSLQDNTFNKQITGIYDMRADYISANLTPQPRVDSSFVTLPDAGIAVFRTGNDSAATYLALLGRNGGSLFASESHNQADEASFMMMVNGQMMAMDPGYLHYVLRDSVATADQHNTILVDGKATDIGYPGKSNGANAYIEKYFSSSVQNYAEVRTAYQQANINRKIMHVRNKYFLMIDHMNSASPREYSMLIHGYGTNGLDSVYNGKFFDFTNNKRAAWKRKQSGLYTYTNSDLPFSISTKQGRHEHTYFFIQHHIYTSANSQPNTNMSYMTVLQPFKNMATDTFPVTTFNMNGALGYKITEGSNLDIAISKSFGNAITINKATTGLTYTYATDAPFFWSSEVPGGAVNDLFVYQATHLTKDNDTLLTTDKPFNIQYLSNGNKSYKGFAGDSGMVHFHTGGYPYQVLGPGVWSMKYDSIRKIGSVYFGKATNFVINIDDSKVGLNEVEEQLGLTAFPNPASDFVNIRLDQTTNNGSFIHVYDISGKMVVNQELPSRTNEFQLPTGHLDQGIYFLRITDPFGQSSKTIKLLLTR